MDIRTRPTTGEVAVRINASERRWLNAALVMADTCCRLEDDTVAEPAAEAYAGLKKFIAALPVAVVTKGAKPCH